MTDVPSPRATRLRAPSWLDGRFVAGVLLVLASVVVGARVLAAADRADRVYAVTRDLAVGTTVQPDDLRVVKARFWSGGDRYVSASGPKPVGWTVARPLGAGEVLPRDALRATPAADVRLVTVPVARGHFPAGLAHGDVVDVYLTAKTAAAGGTARPTPALVATGLVVDAVADQGGRLSVDATSGVVLRVPTGAVAEVVGAVEGGAVDLVRLPPGTS